MIRLSRRQLALYGAQALLEGNEHVVGQLAAYLISTRRTKEVSLLVKDIEMALADKGTLVARVKSAHELEPAAKTAIETLLKDRYQAKDITLLSDIEPDLLGGVLIESAGDEYDGSLQRSINRLKALNV